VRFIFEPDRTSPNGITYSWLIHDAYGGKEKAATATRAFWLPFAYRHSGNYSEAELRDLAQQSIWQMEAQIQHLREEFDLGLGRPSTTELVGATDAENLPTESGTALVQLQQLTCSMSSRMPYERATVAEGARDRERTVDAPAIPGAGEGFA
jgi:hypothetical protein